MKYNIRKRPTNKPIFRMGRAWISKGVKAKISRKEIGEAIQRHRACDWGEVSESMRNSNYFAIDVPADHPHSIWSIYRSDGIEFWIVTLHSRRSTTICLPEEYR